MIEQAQNILNISIIWLQEDGIHVFSILLITWLISKVLHVLVSKAVRRLVPGDSFHLPSEEEKRENTLISIIQ